MAVLATGGVCLIALAHPRLGIGVEGPPGSLVRCFAEFTLGMAACRMSQSHWAGAMLARDSVTLGLSLATGAALAARYDLPAVLLFPLIVAAYALNKGIAACIMQTRPLHFLGVISFSLYLLHNPFRPLELHILKAFVSEPVSPAFALAFALAGALSVVPFAWLTYIGIEQPGRRLVQTLFDRWKRPLPILTGT